MINYFIFLEIQIVDCRFGKKKMKQEIVHPPVKEEPKDIETSKEFNKFVKNHFSTRN